MSKVEEEVELDRWARVSNSLFILIHFLKCNIVLLSFRLMPSYCQHDILDPDIVFI